MSFDPVSYMMGKAAGGGGREGIPLLTRESWNALSTAQKKSYGLVAVQYVESGFDRGVLYNGADYIPHLEYIRTNYSDFSIRLANWIYDLGDTFELIYKQNRTPKEYGLWPYVIRTEDDDFQTAAIYAQYNLYASRKVMNFTYNGSYSGDSNVSYSSPFDYENFYKLRCEAGAISILKGDHKSSIDTVAGSQTFTTASGNTGKAMVLFPLNQDGSRTDNSFYRLSVWRNNVLIHDYLPYTDGVVDAVTNDIYTTSSTGHINGPVV